MTTFSLMAGEKPKIIVKNDKNYCNFHNEYGKVCTHCCKFKKWKEYGASERHRDGYKSWCLQCSTDVVLSLYYLRKGQDRCVKCAVELEPGPGVLCWDCADRVAEQSREAYRRRTMRDRRPGLLAAG